MMHYPKSRAEWLELRRAYVSSSESSALFGLNKYMTAYELGLIKSGRIAEDSEGDERTEWGSLLERVIAHKFAGEAGIKVRALSGYAAVGRMGASFDFEIIGGTSDSEAAQLYRRLGAGILEIKNVDSLIYRDEWQENEAPPHIECQLQHQLDAIDRNWAILAVLVGGNRLKTFTRLRDPEVGAALRERIAAFWAALDGGNLPDPILPRDAALICKFYRSAQAGVAIPASAEVSVIAANYLQAAAIEKKAGVEKELCKAQLLPLIGEASKVVGEGFTISCGEVAAADVSYHREAYRQFRINQSKAARPALLEAQRSVMVPQSLPTINEVKVGKDSSAEI